ncbi:hypothetical protein LIER_32170 [Lithospermum erythrorhizon]|uniref:Retrovirus-related Pol polyprotein from transposon TNT 1-94 n=1 Tax=Lithospermum erythrorhizon TaxID=34254 RepID=A0AAV3RUE0_LITER
MKPDLTGSEVEEERMMLFLMGLNDEYDAIRNQILLMDPLPTLSRSFVMVTNVEKQERYPKWKSNRPRQVVNHVYHHGQLGTPLDMVEENVGGGNFQIMIADMDNMR